MKNKFYAIFLLITSFIWIVSCETTIWRSINISVEPNPRLTIVNQTGHEVRITSPVRRNVEHQASTIYQIPELEMRGRQISIEYYINHYRFSLDVTVDRDRHVTLTQRPPELTVKNDTGRTISITQPFQQVILNGQTSRPFPKQSPRIEPRHVVQYYSGKFSFIKEGMLSDEDITVVVTERAPFLTIENNTGNTINIVHIRNSDTLEWGFENLLTMRLDEFGDIRRDYVATTGIERRGSFLNGESFTFWMGNVDNIEQNPDRFDIRVDDVHSVPYTQTNIQILEDLKIIFTSSDRVR